MAPDDRAPDDMAPDDVAPDQVAPDDMAPDDAAGGDAREDESAAAESSGRPMPRRRRVALISAGIVLAVFAGLSVVLALQLDGGTPDYQGTALLGDPVPALTLPELSPDGGSAADAPTVDLAALRGEVAIVNFFNSWCIPCKEEEPALKEFFAAHRDEDDFNMIGIVRDDTEGDMRALVRDHNIGWTVVLDPGARASVDFGTTGQPETFAVASDGTIVGIHRGRATIADLESMLALARRR